MAGNRKRKRTPKRSQGVHGATKHPLTEGEKVRLGKGLFETFAPIGSIRHEKKAAAQ